MDNRSEENVCKRGRIRFDWEGVRGTLEVEEDYRVHIYKKPVIPEGYRYLSGDKYGINGIWTIERMSDESQAFWLPIESLDDNGTMDGTNFTEKLGRRNVCNTYELLNGEIFDQILSCRRYGGIYIFKYPISINSETNEPQSIWTENPYATKDPDVARRIASMVDTRPDGSVKSHLVYGSEWDSLLEWIKAAGVELDAIWNQYYKWTQEKCFTGWENAAQGELVIRGEDSRERKPAHYAKTKIIPVALSIQ